MSRAATQSAAHLQRLPMLITVSSMMRARQGTRHMRTHWRGATCFGRTGVYRACMAWLHPRGTGKAAPPCKARGWRRHKGQITSPPADSRKLRFTLSADTHRAQAKSLTTSQATHCLLPRPYTWAHQSAAVPGQKRHKVQCPAQAGQQPLPPKRILRERDTGQRDTQ